MFEYGESIMKVFPLLVLAFIISTPVACLSHNNEEQSFPFSKASALQNQSKEGESTLDASNVQIRGGKKLIGTILASYSWLRHKFYLAQEAEGDFEAPKSMFNSLKPFPSSSDFSDSFYNTSSFLAYCPFPESIFYFRLGLVYGKFSSFKNTLPSFIFKEKSSRSSRSRLNFFGGVGLQTYFIKQTMVRLEWTRDIMGIHVSALTAPSKANNTHTRINSIKLGIVYKIPL